MDAGDTMMLGGFDHVDRCDMEYCTAIATRFYTDAGGMNHALCDPCLQRYGWPPYATVPVSELEKLRAEVSRLTGELERLRADAERLDWLEAHRPRMGQGEWGEVRLLARDAGGRLLASRPLLRDAVDAARSSGAATRGERP